MPVPTVHVEVRVMLGSGPSWIWWDRKLPMTGVTDKDVKRAWKNLLAERLSHDGTAEETTFGGTLRQIMVAAIDDIRRRGIRKRRRKRAR